MNSSVREHAHNPFPTHPNSMCSRKNQTLKKQKTNSRPIHLEAKSEMIQKDLYSENFKTLMKETEELSR